jgi:hypothetical protein
MGSDRAEGVEHDLALLRTLAERAIPGTPLDTRDCHGHWSPYFNFHGDPYVNDETPGWGSVATICTGPEDYGRSRAEFIAAADPNTVLGLLDEIERLHKALETEGYVKYERTSEGWKTTFVPGTSLSRADDQPTNVTVGPG